MNRKALRVDGSTETLSQNKWNTLQNLVSCLHRLEIVLKRLCSEDACLLKADSSIYFLLSKLKNYNNYIAAWLHQRFLERYVSRRQMMLLHFHNPKFLQSKYFPELSKAQVRRCGKKVFERLYNNELGDSEDEEINASTTSKVFQTENDETLFLSLWMTWII